jgi:hypothetical protein
MKSPLVIFGFLVCGCAMALADDPSSNAGASADKAGYNLLKPVPSDLLRPVRMQAYDNVTDPTTVDAGHVQVEGALFDLFTVSRHYSSGFTGDVSQDSYSWRPRVTVGLLNNLDLEVMPTYSAIFAHEKGLFATPFGPMPVDQNFSSSGFGPVIVESKLNLWGNDGGRTAMSISPVVSIPTDRGDVLVALDAAFALRLPQGFYVKVESEILQQRFFGKDYVQFYEGLSINKSICSRLDAYAALTANVSSSPQEWFGYAGFGAIYKVTRDFQLFGGLNFGLTDNSFDYNPRFGVVWRR